MKVEDISQKEAWPTLSKVFPLLLTGIFIWCLYQGALLVAGLQGWPLTIPFYQPTPESYQEYLKNYQDSQRVGQVFIGPMLLLLGGFVLRRPLFRLVRKRLNKRTEEVEKQE